MNSNPLLVNAVDLDRWADTLESKGVFPELMRRLLAQTPGVSNINIRAHEGTAAPGWDGTATSDGSSFLPKGELRFEFGTNQRPKAKADEDYNKRVEQIAGKSDEIFVFATPRNWAGAAEWAKRRGSENKFASVEAFDAHRLEGWLQSTPAVHYWLSEMLGKPVTGAQTLKSWWERLRRNCEIEVPTGFHIAGRHQEADKLLDLLATSEKVLSIQAAWRNDTLAFLHAVLRERSPAELERTMVVTDAVAWQYLAFQPRALILIPLFDNPDIGLAHDNGYRIVHVLDESEGVRSDDTTIRLPKIDRVVATEELEKAQVYYLEASRLSALARRGMGAFYRKISLDPARRKPGWVKDESIAKYLAPLVLVGGWEDENAKDREVISTFLELSYDEITHLLEQVREEYPDDHPFARSGNRWCMVDPIDAADQLLLRLSPDNLKRWDQLVKQTLLGEYELFTCNRSVQGGQEWGGHASSWTLMTCVAKSLALIAQIANGEGQELWQVQARLRDVIGMLLTKAFNDNSSDDLFRLNYVLPYIAEAQPLLFLAALEKDLRLSEPLLGNFVCGWSGVGWSSPNRVERVVAALQCLCWSTDYAARAALLIAELSKFDCSRDELEYIADEFALAIVGHDRISIIGKTDAQYIMERVFESCSKLFDLLVGRLLFRDFWPAHPFEPIYRDWVTCQKGSGDAEFAVRQKELLRVIVNFVREHAHCWLSLLHLIDRLEPCDRKFVLEVFKECFLSGRFDADQQFAFWSYLHSLVLDYCVRQRREGSLSLGGYEALADLVELLEPVADPRRYVWLFERPERLCVRGLVYQDEGFHETLWGEREAALSVTMREGGQSLRVLVDASPNAACIGECLAGLNLCPGELILSWFGDESLNLRSAASSYVLHKVRRDGVPWVIGILEGNSLSSENKCSFVASLPCDEKILELVSGAEFELRVAFFQHVNVFEIDMQQRGCVLDELLELGCVAQAVELLTLMLSVGDSPDVANVFRVLSMLLVVVERDRCIVFHDVVVELLSFLESVVPDHSDLPRFELLFSCHGYGVESLRALYHYFGREPDCFAECVIAIGDTFHDGRDDFEVQLRFNEIVRWWQIIPGLHVDGTVDFSFLMGWVETVHNRLMDYVSVEKSARYVGYVLASSPHGADGMWPAEAVRSVIEHMESSFVEEGVFIRCYNLDSRGTRSDYIGGAREWRLVNRYRQYSRRMSLRWPRTAALLARLADEYENEARLEDIKAEESADQD